MREAGQNDFVGRIPDASGALQQGEKQKRLRPDSDHYVEPIVQLTSVDLRKQGLGASVVTVETPPERVPDPATSAKAVR